MQTPHFDLPLRYVNGLVAVVEQDSIADVKNCVEAAVRTELGTRPWVPTFGITDPTFQEQPVDLAVMAREITQSESRAILNMTQSPLPTDNLVDTIVVGVNNGKF